jgi:hypothetical protein
VCVHVRVVYVCLVKAGKRRRDVREVMSLSSNDVNNNIHKHVTSLKVGLKSAHLRKMAVPSERRVQKSKLVFEL